MEVLTQGERISLLNGGFVTIKKELGQGGQGIVYVVDMNGEQKALKWYHEKNRLSQQFYNNLAHNVEHPVRSSAFLWPLCITKRQKGSFGYVMDLCPDNFSEFRKFLLAYKKFNSFQPMLAAAMKICDSFRLLHLSGYSYRDLNDGNFFIDPETGDVRICDNDNVMPEGEKTDIRGKVRYMAPEIVNGGIPDKYSDLFSLSVILFMLIYANHPFEGQRGLDIPIMNEVLEKKFYGSEAVFIYDPYNDTNRPLRGRDDNVIRRWPYFPAELRKAFIHEFSPEVLNHKEERRLELRWEQLFASLRDRLIICPHCGEEMFFDEAKPQCMNCYRDVDVSKWLRLGMRKIPLVNNKFLFIDYDNTPEVRVVSNQQDEMSLQNLTNDTWTAETPSGKIKKVGPKEFMPVKNEIKISFSSTESGKIVVK